MPDHFNLLAKLAAEKIAIPTRKIKGELSPVLRRQGLKWQPSFYDHRLRPDDKVGGVLRYMWLNPYRAGLADSGENWTGWWCSPEGLRCIEAKGDHAPIPEWWK